MTKSTLSSASVVLFGAAVAAVLVFSTGCEWESSDSEGSWNDSMGWVNFSGLYRSGDGSRALVSNFSLSSGGTGDTGTDTGTDSGDFNEFAVANQVGPTKPAGFTIVEDVIAFQNRGLAGWYIKPGSVTITLNGEISGVIGQFTDDGSGTLSGTYSQVAIGPSFVGTGVIDYDTGDWSVTLEGDKPFLEPAELRYTYAIVQDPTGADSGGGGGGVIGDGDTGTGEEPPTSGSWVYTLQVAQTGNRLSFTDNRGFVWEGVLSSMTTPGGDDTGRSPGDVVGTFEVKGVTDSRYKITGTLSGNYQVFQPDDGVMYGQLTERRIQGIWMEPDGNGDLYGETSDAAQATVTTTTTE